MLEREAAHNELATAWRLIGFVHGIAGRYGQASEAIEQLDRARAQGRQRAAHGAQRAWALR